MSNKFSYSGPVTISHINARKEGPDDDKELAVDLKLSMVTDATILDLFDDQLAAFFFTDINAVRNTQVGPVPFKTEMEGYRLEAVGGTFFGVKVKKFTVQPKDGFMAEVCFQISFKPSGDEVARMAEFLQEEMAIKIEPANDELDLGPPVRKVAECINNILADEGASATLTFGEEKSIAFGNGSDAIYPEAVKIVLRHGKASISLVQRHLRIGYNRAARLIETMERNGLVSAIDSSGSRQVLENAA